MSLSYTAIPCDNRTGSLSSSFRNLPRAPFRTQVTMAAMGEDREL